MNKMRKVICVFIAFLIVFNFTGFGVLNSHDYFESLISHAQSSEDIDIEAQGFSDSELENVIRESLGKSKDDKIFLSELRGIKELSAEGKNISNITGIEQLVNIEFLNLNSNKINDISNLFFLSKLKYLQIADNELSNISALSNLKELELLVLSGNKITSVVPLSSFYKYKLKSLFLNNNNIKSIDKISMLLYNLDALYIANNPLDSYDFFESLNNLKDTDIEQGNQVEPTVLPTTGAIENTPAPVSTATPKPTENTITPVSTPTAKPTEGSVSISANPSANPTGSYATPSATPSPPKNSTDIVPSIVVTPKVSYTCTPYIVTTPIPSHTTVPTRKPVFFPDKKLDSVIRTQISKDSGRVIYLDEVDKITKIEFDSKGIVSLQGIQNLQSLTNLMLRGNQIEDITPVGNLTKLIELDIESNKVLNIYPLRNLVDLKFLWLKNNKIENIDCLNMLSSYKQLKILDASKNEITDILGIGELESLVELRLNDNNISDISPVKKLTKLKVLYLNNNKTKDFSVLKQLFKDNNIESDIHFENNTPVPSHNTDKPVSSPILSSAANVSVILGAISKPNEGDTTPNATPTNYAVSKDTPTATPRPTEVHTSTPTAKSTSEITKKIPSAMIFKELNNHWARDNIKKLIDLGIISGYPDGSVKPNNEITRAEITVMLVKAIGLTPSTKKVYKFKDDSILPGWSYYYIQRAVEKGIVSGYKNGTFKPSEKINRQEMVVMALRTFGIKSKDEGTLDFDDSVNIPDWARGYVIKAVDCGIVNGYSKKKFMGERKLTRAEAATIIAKCFDLESSYK